MDSCPVRSWDVATTIVRIELCWGRGYVVAMMDIRLEIHCMTPCFEFPGEICFRRVDFIDRPLVRPGNRSGPKDSATAPAECAARQRTPTTTPARCGTTPTSGDDGFRAFGDVRSADRCETSARCRAAPRPADRRVRARAGCRTVASRAHTRPGPGTLAVAADPRAAVCRAAADRDASEMSHCASWRGATRSGRLFVVGGSS